VLDSGISIYSYRSNHVCGVLLVKAGDYEKTRFNARFVLSEVCSKDQARLDSAEEMDICWERAEAQRREIEERAEAQRKKAEARREEEEKLRNLQGDMEDIKKVLRKTVGAMTYRGDFVNEALKTSEELSQESKEFLEKVSKQIGTIGIQF
jgi:hypothetical protein